MQFDLKARSFLKGSSSKRPLKCRISKDRCFSKGVVETSVLLFFIVCNLEAVEWQPLPTSQTTLQTQGIPSSNARSDRGEILVPQDTVKSKLNVVKRVGCQAKLEKRNWAAREDASGLPSPRTSALPFDSPCPKLRPRDPGRNTIETFATSFTTWSICRCDLGFTPRCHGLLPLASEFVPATASLCTFF